MRFSYSHAQVEKVVLEDSIQKLCTRIRELNRVAAKSGYSEPESAINLPFDAHILKEVKQLVARKITPNTKEIVLLGAGGSILGAQAVYEAIRGKEDFLTKTYPKIRFVNTLEEKNLEHFGQYLDETTRHADDILFVVVSKSGKTLETLSGLEFLRSPFGNRSFDIRERIVVVTDEHSPLWEAACSRGIATLLIPKEVGGRYSVFSAAGLFPLAAAGIDIEGLLKGARQVRDIGLLETSENISACSAILLTEHAKKHRKIVVSLFLSSDLSSLGDWYSQLLAESIGKEEDLDGDPVHAGLTPLNAFAPADMHSLGQLFLGGPKDKFTYIIQAERSNSKESKVKELLFPELWRDIKTDNVASISQAFQDVLPEVYAERKLPFAGVTLDAVNAQSIGAFMQWRMLEVMYVANILNVNAFDQPHVAIYKDAVHKKLVQ